MIMKTSSDNNINKDNNEYSEYNEEATTQEKYYDDTTYGDDNSGNTKKFIIIGGIVVAIILLLLLFMVFGGKGKKTVDSNNSLKNLVIEGAELEPSFNKDVLEYELKNVSDTIRLTCQLDSENASVVGCDSEEINTSTLTDDIEIVVKAANGEERKYIIKVNEGYDGIKFIVNGNDSEWSSKPVTLSIDDVVSEKSLAEDAYSFDGGKTWQKENKKTFNETSTVVVKVKDSEGRISKPETIEVKIDKDAKLLINSVDGQTDDWTDSDVTLTIDATSTNSLAEEAYSFDGGKTWQKDASKTFNNMQDVVIVVKDDKGNISKEVKTKVKIDKTKPTVKITGSVASGVTTTNNVVLRALTSNSPSGYKYQWYKDSNVIDGAVGSNYTATGSGTYSVKVVNGVGKEASSSSYVVNKVVSSGWSNSRSSSTNTSKSSNTSTVTINSVSGNPTSWTKNNVVLTVSAKTTKGSLEYSFDNGSTWQRSNKKTFTNNQDVYIKVRNKSSRKEAGRIVKITKIDKYAPTVKLSVNGSGFVKKIDTKITVTDSGVAKIGDIYFALSTSGTKQPSTFKSKVKSGQKVRITNSGNNVGTYYLWIKVSDNLGNQRVMVSKAFKIDNQKPSVPKVHLYKWAKNSSSYSPTSTKLKGATTYKAGTWSNKYIFTYANKSSDGKGAGGVYYQLTVTGKSTNVTNKKQNARNIATNGISYVKYRACDKLGNCSAYTTNYKIMFDNQPPTLSFSPAKADSYYVGQKIYAYCTDTNSGLKYMKTWFTQDSKVYRLYNSTATTKKTSQNIAINVTGSNKSVTTLCKDAAGNSTGNKVSPKLTIKKKVTTSSSTSSSSGSSNSGSSGGSSGGSGGGSTSSGGSNSSGGSGLNSGLSCVAPVYKDEACRSGYAKTNGKCKRTVTCPNGTKFSSSSSACTVYKSADIVGIRKYSCTRYEGLGYGTCTLTDTVWCSCKKYISCPAVYDGVSRQTYGSGCYYEYTPAKLPTCSSSYKYNASNKKCCK